MRRWTIGQGYVLPVALLVMLLGADVAMPRGPARGWAVDAARALWRPDRGPRDDASAPVPVPVPRHSTYRAAPPAGRHHGRRATNHGRAGS